MLQDCKIVDKFVITNVQLGKGSFGQVFRGYKQEDPSFLVAVKQIPVASLKDSKMIKLLTRELDILTKINNPHIVKLIHKTRTPNNIYIFLEFCNGGDLSQLLKKRGGYLSEQEAILYFRQILNGFKEIYQQNIIHRDIKPANILLHDFLGRAKIADFGFARVVDDMDNKAELTILGSPLYMAPQILKRSQFSSKCDIWSLGILLYELLYGRTPWTAKDPTELINNILTKPLSFPNQPIRSSMIKELLMKMLQIQEEQRMRWEELFVHAVMKLNENDILQQITLIQQSQMDELERADQLNKLYLQSNKVRNQGEQTNEIKTFITEKQSESQDSEQSNSTSSQQSINETNFDQNMNNMQILQTQNKKLEQRKVILQIDAFLMFKRNVGIFINVTSTQLYQLQKDGILKFSDYFFEKIYYALWKYQMIIFQEVSKILASQIPIENGFTQEQWKLYKGSNEYFITLNAIKSEVQVIKQYYGAVLKKCKDDFSNPNLQVSQSEQKELQEFMVIMNQDLIYDDIFRQIYEATVKQGLKMIAQTNLQDSKFKQNQTALITSKYLKISVNPFNEFRWEEFCLYKDLKQEGKVEEFNKFYEKYENLDLHSLLMELKEDLMESI